MFLFFSKLDFVQIEVSTRCQLSCLMCPKSFFRWKAKDMGFEEFKKIPFSRFRYAHLQGWGEPLLNSELGEMIEFAKKHCKLSLTTNGLLLPEWKEEIAKLDLIAISIAGINGQREVRKTKLEELAEKIETITSLKKKPKVVIATLMMKNTISELPMLVEFAKSIKADELIANNLDYIPSRDLVGYEVFSENPSEEYLRIIETAKKKAEELKIKFVARPIKIEEALVCAENPIKNCFITADCNVSPCAYLHLPTEGEYITRFFKGQEFKVMKQYFGKAEEFYKVWKSKSYSDFRKIYEYRLLKPYLPLPECCRSCYKAYSL
ncbi:MAG: radical SAM/SPASM domain-containing protein [Archaeoglobaceae archaeon]